ncbi:hypothetical protein ACFVMC_15500 [Nocardia sp. NPDC127579]|uniref:hypothetical protein n=1 Tax=Nocardia sp. NPDC127579 TaxID=3345402 RepID=UPI00363B7537
MSYAGGGQQYPGGPTGYSAGGQQPGSAGGYPPSASMGGYQPPGPHGYPAPAGGWYGPPPVRPNRTPWIVGGLVLIAVAVLLATVVLTSRGGDDADAATPGNYSVAGIGNSCDIIDLTRIERWSAQSATPENTEFEGSSFSGPSLSCRVRNQTGGNAAELKVSAALHRPDQEPSFLSNKRFATIGATVGSLPGYGEQTFAAEVTTGYVPNGGKGDTFRYTAGVLDSNLTVYVELLVEYESELSEAEIKTVVLAYVDEVKQALRK